MFFNFQTCTKYREKRINDWVEDVSTWITSFLVFATHYYEHWIGRQMAAHNERIGRIGMNWKQNLHRSQSFSRPELHHTTIEKYENMNINKVLTKMLQLFLIFYLYKAYYNIVCTYISVLETPIHFSEILSYSTAGFSFSFLSHFS